MRLVGPQDEQTIQWFGFWVGAGIALALLLPAEHLLAIPVFAWWVGAIENIIPQIRQLAMYSYFPETVHAYFGVMFMLLPVQVGYFVFRANGALDSLIKSVKPSIGAGVALLVVITAILLIVKGGSLQVDCEPTGRRRLLEPISKCISAVHAALRGLLRCSFIPYKLRSSQAPRLAWTPDLRF